MKTIYLDNNATTAVAPEVREAMLPYLTDLYGNPSSMHTFGGQVGRAVEEARERMAALLGAHPDEIIFTSCGSESDNAAIWSALQTQPEKRHLITTRVEHPAILNVAQYWERQGYRVTLLGVDNKGRLDLDEYAAALSDDSRTLAAVTMGQSSGVFTSYVVFYRINSESALTTTALTGSLIYDLIPMGSRFCAVMEEQLCFLDDSGEVRAAYSCGSDYLRRVDCGDGYAALLLGRYRNGTQHRLVTVDSDGQVMASLDVDGEVLSMSAAGRYIAVLFSDRMVIYDKTLAECARLDAVSEARQVLMRADGSAVLAGSTAASLYLP